MTLVKIPAGTFAMGTGSMDYDWLGRSRPVHPVTISRAFFIGKYEVTQAQYEAVMGVDPSFFTGDNNRPVEQINWNEATAFCEALKIKSGYNVHLPSEAQWEYACKADHGNEDTNYHFGNDPHQLPDYAWHGVNSGGTTWAVGKKLPNSFGLYDMCGNVWEWCNDWYAEDYYSSSPSTDPPGPSSGTLRVLRGGAYNSFEYSCRSASRHYGVPSEADADYGFRVVVGE